MFGMERIGGTVGEMAREADESLRVALDHGLNLSGRNAWLARKWMQNAAEESRSQALANQRLAQRMLDNAGEQCEAFQALAQESLDSYMRLISAPFSLCKRQPGHFEDNVRSFPGVWSVDEGFPIKGYDELSVAGVSGHLSGLSDEQIQQVREYEKKHKNRHSLIQRLDRKIGNAS